MDLSNLKPAKGATHRGKRLGRGQGSGKGGTSTRGTKGAKSRSGNANKAGFEGGQMPLQRRTPKFGQKPINRIEYKPINLSLLQRLAEEKNITKVTPEVLIQAGLARNKDLIKILGKGTLSAKVDVEAHAFSKAAEQAIRAAGGTIVKL